MAIPYDISRQALISPAARPTVFAANASPAPWALASEAARLAYLRAEHGAGDLQKLNDALLQVGFSAPHVLADTATGSFAFCTYRAPDELALVAFRGTEPDDPSDLMTDLSFLPSPWGHGKVHAGFARAAMSLSPGLVEWLGNEASKRKRLLLCGHSLGAALATLFASMVSPTAVITIGSPRVGNDDFVRALPIDRMTRVVNCSDIVTALPPGSPFYRHAGKIVYVDAQGIPHQEPDVLFMLRDQVTAQADFVTQLLGRFSPQALFSRPFADHSPINYVRAFF
jgi:hypothetical protein